MERYKAVIRGTAGENYSVDVALTVGKDFAWTGHFEFPIHSGIKGSMEYQLELDDGRQGTILVNALTWDPNRGPVANFKFIGQGKLEAKE